MASLKEVRNRIVSVSSTQQITKAMKMVSAAKLKRAQDAIVQMRPYANKLKEILENLSASLENSVDAVYTQEREIKKVLVIVITSNRGLCGAFNANVIKTATRLTQTTYKEQYKTGNFYIAAIGKKASDFFVRNNYKVVSAHNELFDHLTFEQVALVAEKIMKSFAEGEYDKIEIVYNQFKNAGVQVLTQEQYLPVQSNRFKTNANKKKKTDYIFEPNKEYIIKELIPKSLKIQLYKALLDSHAAEHGARMTAMHKATDNAGTLIKELKLSYNKARQAAITNEILEIVGGAEALKG